MLDSVIQMSMSGQPSLASMVTQSINANVRCPRLPNGHSCVGDRGLSQSSDNNQTCPVFALIFHKSG